MTYPSERARWIGGLLVILSIYTLFYLTFADRDVSWIPRRIRHVIKFFFTFAVYLAGTYHLGPLKDRWMSYGWHLIHIGLLFVITAVGLYDWIFGAVGENIREITGTMQEFLISPVLYVGMGILNNRLNKA
jgi:hypothetical protein